MTSGAGSIARPRFFPEPFAGRVKRPSAEAQHGEGQEQPYAGGSGYVAREVHVQVKPGEGYQCRQRDRCVPEPAVGRREYDRRNGR